MRVDVELGPEEISLIMSGLNKLYDSGLLNDDERDVIAGLSFKLGGAMAAHLLGGES